MHLITRIVLLCAFSAAAPALLAQITTPTGVTVDSPPKSVYLKINPFTALSGPIPLTAEYRIGLEFVSTQRLSYVVAAGYLAKSLLFKTLNSTQLGGINPDDIEFPGYHLLGQVRYYFLKYDSRQKVSSMMVPSGAFVALHGSYAYATYKLRSFSYPRFDFSHFNLCAVVGSQVIGSDVLGLECYAGIGYKQNRIVETDAFLNRHNRDPVSFGLSEFYAGNLKLLAGFNFTFGLL